MKRLICLLSVLCLLLAGCGQSAPEAAPETAPPTEPSTEAPTQETEPTTEATEAPTQETEPTTEATEAPAGSFANPLTGEPMDTAFTGRPVAFSLNNAAACLPQYGLDDLDWMFEMEVEGDVTRCVGLMIDPVPAEKVGPIRSCRTYFLNLSVSYNAPLFHCGASPYANNRQYSASASLSSWDHFDEMGSAGKYFYRDSSRAGVYATEHTLFTSGEKMAEAMASKGFQEGTEPLTYGYQFADTVALDGQEAEEITVTFRGTKRTVMEFDDDTGLYEAHQYGDDWIDGSTGENAAFRNVLVVFAKQSKVSTGHSFYELGGSGEGFFAVDGKMVPVQWQHADAEGPFTFTLADGTPITLGVGATYCAIVDVSGSVTAE